jgi:nucleoside-diphosphate-sugar epimerase
MTIPATAASGCIGAWVVRRLLAEIVRVIETTGPSAKERISELARLHKDGRLDARELG